MCSMKWLNPRVCSSSNREPLATRAPTAAVGCPLSTSKTTRMPLLSVMTSGLRSPLLITMVVVIAKLSGSLIGIPSSQALTGQRNLAIILERQGFYKNLFADLEHGMDVLDI